MDMEIQRLIDKQLQKIKELGIEDGADYVHIHGDSNEATIVWLNGGDSGRYENGFFEEVTIALTEKNIEDLQSVEDLCSAECVESETHYCYDVGEKDVDAFLFGVQIGYWEPAVDGRQFILNYVANQNKQTMI